MGVAGYRISASFSIDMIMPHMIENATETSMSFSFQQRFFEKSNIAGNFAIH
jgi:hypothetical protein